MVKIQRIYGMKQPKMYASITGFSFEPKWRILYLRGYFYSPFPTKEVKIIIDGKHDAGKANIGWRYVDNRFFDERYRGFVYEKQVDTPIRRGTPIEAHCYDEKGNKLIARRLLGEHPGKKNNMTPSKSLNPYTKFYTWVAERFPQKISKHPIPQFFIGFIRPTAMKQNAKVKKMQSKADTANNKLSKIDISSSDRDQVIFFSVHNLDVEERREKRRCFEKIDQCLRQWGWKILTIHHSNFELETSLEFVQLLETVIPSEWDNKKWMNNPEAKYALFEAASLLKGHMVDKNKKVSWEECYKQVVKEAVIFEYLVRRHKPYGCILWHQWNSMAHMNRYICELYEIPFLYTHEGFLADTLGIDTIGEMAESWPATHAKEFNALPINSRDLNRADNYTAHLIEKSLDRKMQTSPGAVKEIVDTIKEKTGRPVLFYAGVNDWQTGMLPVWWHRAMVHSPHFVDTYDAYEYLYRLCEENDWYMLFKPHPNVPPRPLPFKSERIVNLKYANILECVQETDVSITLMSTVAYVAMVHSKPVVLIGRNSLSGSGAVYEIFDIEDTANAIHAAIEKKEWDDKQRLWREHVARLLRHYLFPYSDISANILNKSFQDAARFILKHTKPGNFHKIQSD